MTASSEAEALASAQQSGRSVIAIRATGRQPSVARIRTGNSAGNFKSGLFAQQLLTLLEAGLGLVESVELLAKKAAGQSSEALLNAVFSDLRSGLSFSHALQKQENSFPLLLISTVRSSERTGALPEALRRYITYDEQINAVKNKIISAAVYPLLLMVFAGLVVLFLLGYVVPRFSVLYEDIGELPLLSKLLMQWGRFVSEGGWLALMLLVISFVAAVVWMYRTRSRAWLEGVLWRIPGIGQKLHLHEMARVTRTLSMLVYGGMPLVSSLETVMDLFAKSALYKNLRAVTSTIKEGGGISASFSSNDLANDVGTRLLQVAERSGDLASSLGKIAGIYDEEISRWIDRAMKLFEPAMMIVTGAIIGGIVLLMYFPIFELANSIE